MNNTANSEFGDLFKSQEMMKVNYRKIGVLSCSKSLSSSANEAKLGLHQGN